jgi:3-hydroxybutyrate dehydrogenase
VAKHGLAGLCKAVAKEGGPYGVRSYLICPGFVLTPPLKRQIIAQAKTMNITEEELHKIMLKDTVSGEFTAKEDVAETALFFASFKTSALTGQSLNVCHGWVMS